MFFHNFVHIETAMFRAHFQRHPGFFSTACLIRHIWISIEMTCDLAPAMGGTKKMHKNDVLLLISWKIPKNNMDENWWYPPLTQESSIS